MFEACRESIARIRHMEQLFDFVTDILQNTPDELRSPSVKEAVGTLLTYYESGEWQHDYELDERRLLPPDLKRGVLSQDGLYDLLTEITMTEKEKMQKQMLYDANHDRVLTEERKAAKDMCYEYNLLRPSDEGGQTRLMKKLLGKTHGSFCIVAPFWCDYGYNIEIGNNFFANHNTVILDGAKVKFGDNVFIAPDCGFHTAGHPIDYERRNAGLEYAYPITVGDNVWIGAGVQVMPGVTIGSNVVIGGGSVVVKDIPDNCVAVGNPCRVIRPITEEDKKKHRDI